MNANLLTVMLPARCLAMVSALSHDNVNVQLSQEQTPEGVQVYIESLATNYPLLLKGKGASLAAAYVDLHAQLLARMQEQLPQHATDSFFHQLYQAELCRQPTN